METDDIKQSLHELSITIKEQKWGSSQWYRQKHCLTLLYISRCLLEILIELRAARQNTNNGE